MTSVYRCKTCKNWDNFYHGCNLYIFETRLDKKKEIIHPYMHEDAYNMIEFLGCASHSDFQSERDKVLERFVAFRMVCNVKIEDETPGNYYTTLDAWKEFELLLEELRQAGEP